MSRVMDFEGYDVVVDVGDHVEVCQTLSDAAVEDASSSFLFEDGFLVVVGQSLSGSWVAFNCPFCGERLATKEGHVGTGDRTETWLRIDEDTLVEDGLLGEDFDGQVFVRPEDSVGWTVEKVVTARASDMVPLFEGETVYWTWKNTGKVSRTKTGGD